MSGRDAAPDPGDSVGWKPAAAAAMPEKGRHRIAVSDSISCAHQLNLPYPSKCNRLHGHNYAVQVVLEGCLNEHGMVADYARVKEVIRRFDHRNLNDLMSVPATAENLAKTIADALKEELPEGASVVRVSVKETEGTEALYLP